jgi:hypothetical protein
MSAISITPDGIPAGAYNIDLTLLLSNDVKLIQLLTPTV